MEEKPLMRQVLRAGTVGLDLVAYTFVGVAMGYFLDKWLRSSPWFLIVFTVLGIAAGFRQLFKLISKENKSSPPSSD